MALFMFAKAILENKPIKVFNYDTSYAPYKVYNIGNNKPVELTRFIKLLEENWVRRLKKNFFLCSRGM